MSTSLGNEQPYLTAAEAAGSLSTLPASITRSHFGLNFSQKFKLWPLSLYLRPDQRVRGWLLLDHYPPTLALTVMYLLIVWMGPKYMKHRQPYSCRGAMMIYNLGLTLLSFYMFYEVNRWLSFFGMKEDREVPATWCYSLEKSKEITTHYNVSFKKI